MCWWTITEHYFGPLPHRHVGGVTSVASNSVCAMGVAYQATNDGKL